MAARVSVPFFGLKAVLVALLAFVLAGAPTFAAADDTNAGNLQNVLDFYKGYDEEDAAGEEQALGRHPVPAPAAGQRELAPEPSFVPSFVPGDGNAQPSFVPGGDPNAGPSFLPETSETATYVPSPSVSVSPSVTSTVTTSASTSSSPSLTTSTTPSASTTASVSGTVTPSMTVSTTPTTTVTVTRSPTMSVTPSRSATPTLTPSPSMLPVRVRPYSGTGSNVEDAAVVLVSRNGGSGLTYDPITGMANKPLAWLLKGSRVEIVQTVNLPTSVAAELTLRDVFPVVTRPEKRAADVAPGSADDASGVFGGMDNKPVTVEAAGAARSSVTFLLDTSAMPDGAFVLRRRANLAAALVGRNKTDGSGPVLTASEAASYPDSPFLQLDISLTMDSTAPTAVDVAYADLAKADAEEAGTPTSATYPTQYIGDAGSVYIPVSMFNDEVSSQSSQLKLVSVTPLDDSRGFDAALLYVPLSTAQLTAAKVTGTPGVSSFLITVADEIGNEASAVFSVRVYGRAVPMFFVTDPRGAASTVRNATQGAVLFTGSDASRSPPNEGPWRLNVLLVFPDRVSGVDASALSVAVDPPTAAVAFTTPTQVSTSVDGRTFKWTVDVTAFPASGAALVMSVAANAGTRAVDGTETAAPPSVRVVLDRTPPQLTLTDHGAALAVVGTNYFTLIPPSFFEDGSDGTPAADIEVLGGSTKTQIGLTLRPGMAGRAALMGTPSELPGMQTIAGCYSGASKRQVMFTLWFRDLAGNTGYGSVCVAVATLGAGAAAPTLTLASRDKAFSEGAAALTVDGTAAYASTVASSGATEVLVELETPDADPATGGAFAEYLSATVPDPAHFEAVAYAQDAARVGTLGLRAKAGQATPPVLTDSQVTAYLRSITYTNTRKNPRAGLRTVRVTIAGAASAVVAVGSVGIRVAATNSAPAIVNLPAAPVLVSEAADVAPGARFIEKAIMPDAVATDDDDTALTAVRVAMATTATDATFGACMPDRERLALPSTYAGAGVASPIRALWDASRCVLLLTPVEPATTASLQDFTQALQAVVYRNTDLRNPGAYETVPWKLTRRLTVTAVDAASGGQMTAAASSTPALWSLRLVPLDDAPTVPNAAAVYAEGGPLFGRDKFANVKLLRLPRSLSTADGNGPDAVIPARKWTIVVDSASATPLVASLPLALARVSEAAKGAFGGKDGAFLDKDSVDPPAAANITITCIQPLRTGAATGAEGRDSFVVAACPAGVAVPSSLGDAAFVGGAPTYNPGVGGGDSRLPIRVADQSTVPLGEFGLRITFGGSGVQLDVFVDVRAKACPPAALAAPGTLYPHFPACGPKEIEVNGTTTFSATDDATSAAEEAGVYGGEGYSAYAWKSAGGFATAWKAAAARERALLAAGLSSSAVHAAMLPERQAARGAVRVGTKPGSSVVPAGAAGSALTLAPVDPAYVETLSLSLKPDEVLDTSLAQHLGPACTKFAAPVRICLAVGDVPANMRYNLRVVSRTDCLAPRDVVAGTYGDPEQLLDQYTDSAKGIVCGSVSHFSILLPVLVPMPPSPTQPKRFPVSGACPNGCSGHGHCRGSGKCLCFPGFTGLACNQRTCPSAEAWDAVDGVPHAQAECSARGTCNRKKGVCVCNTGFEGAACQRVSCPNGCSGKGRCITVGDAVDGPEDYTSWEARRIGICACDAGYTGPDCSQRLCPFGDDPESSGELDPVTRATAYLHPQVQAITIGFETLPTEVGPTVRAGSTFLPYAADAMALTFTSPSGASLTTGRLSHLWEGGSYAMFGIQNALQGLPNFAVSEVEVSEVTPPTGSAAAALNRTYMVTFTGASVTGRQALLTCPNFEGTPYVAGCPVAGCRPLHEQLRLLSAPSAVVQLNHRSVLQQPAGSTPDAAAMPGRWGVTVNVTIAHRRLADGSIRAVYSASSTIYEGEAGETVDAAPLPPPGLRSNVTLPYGLIVDFDGDALPEDATEDAKLLPAGSYFFKWRLATCSVTEAVAPHPELESLECSGRGLCNRRRGTCRCFHGYHGHSCQAKVSEEDM